MHDPMTTHGAPSWLAHNGPDPDAARRFYEKVLDWNVVDMPMQDGSTYAGIMIGEAPIGGFAPQAVIPNGWLSYITVDDVDARFRAALDEGAESIHEPMDVPGVGRMATLKDPFGAVLALYKAAA